MAGAKASFSSIRIVPHFGTSELGGFDLFWELNAPGAIPEFLVEQADTDAGPWTPTDTQPGQQTFLLDASSKTLTLGVVRWFRITATQGSTVLAVSPPMDHRNALAQRDYLYYRDLLRRWRLQLDKFSGSPGYLLSRKIYGPKCSRCASVILKQATSTNCPECFGTAITGGYQIAVPMMAEWKDGPPDPATTIQGPSGPTKEEKRVIAVFPFPEIKSDDVWVDTGTNYRYLVEAVVVPPTANYRGSAVLRNLTLSVQPPKHPIYNVPLT